MKALVYEGPGHYALENKPKPQILNSTDAIVRVTKTTICGTDLHIIKGDVPEVDAGRILGHEGVGVIEEVGDNVTNFKRGDHVLISCITSCGRCRNCKRGMYSHCENGGGWVLGHLIDGTQAEYVRIPFADNSLHAIPAGADEDALVMLSDIFPTGYECGVLSGQVQPGDTVAIVGSGPIGLATLLTAQFYSPGQIIMLDIDAHRLDVARILGADRTILVTDGSPVEKVRELTEGRGAEVVVEAVGTPQAFDICQSIVAAGGHIANIGVHGKPVQLNLEKLWSQNITLTTRLVDTVTTPLLLNCVRTGKLSPGALITHHFRLEEVVWAYEVFSQASEQGAIKVLLLNEGAGSG